MGSPIKVDVEKRQTKALNMPIDKEIYYDFKVKCKKKGLPLNIVVETFMNQYVNGKYNLSEEKILKWKDANSTKDTDVFNVMFEKNIYNKFKDTVKDNGFYIRHVVSAFVEDYAYNDLTLEFVKAKRKKTK